MNSPFKTNLCVTTDSYKVSHATQFPAGTSFVSYYGESRSENEHLITGGMNLLAKTLEQGITAEDVERAAKLYAAHFGNSKLFAYDLWMRVVNEFGGKLPVRLLALPEGSLAKSKVPMYILEPTHPDFISLCGYLETHVLSSVWYQSTVATRSFKCKEVINRYMKETSCLEGAEYDFVLNTRLHDFGARGVTCTQQMAVGGLSHLYSFIGTDTVMSMIMAQDLYGFEGAAGISIPAREHSTTISWSNEDDAFHNSIDSYGAGVYACVMDSYDFQAAVTRVCTEMKDKIIAAGGTFVIRPDSGDMIQNIMFALETAGKHFGFTYNDKGYKVLSKHVRIIQGDDINNEVDIGRVLSWMEGKRWSAENIAFGMGGGLLQKLNRDTYKFAMKLSAITVDGESRGVRKCPKGAEWKASKAGQLRVYHPVDADGNVDITTHKVVDILTETAGPGYVDAMIEYYSFDPRTGVEVVHNDTLEIVRARVDANLK